MAFSFVLCGLVLVGLPFVSPGFLHLPWAEELPPDIDPVAPRELQVEQDESGRFLLSFDAAFDNVGVGPLRIEGHREDTSEWMVADQLISRSDGSGWLNEDVGELRFAESEDHRHWHFFQFMRYELVQPSDEKAVAPDEKTGFCLGDRYNTDPSDSLPGEPPMPGEFDVPPSNDWCAEDALERTDLTMGLSVGYGDDYKAFLDGQSIDITDVPEGRYYLVHRVNANLLESDYSNNAASVLIELGWPDGSDGSPTSRVLAVCEDSARCFPEEQTFR